MPFPVPLTRACAGIALPLKRQLALELRGTLSRPLACLSGGLATREDHMAWAKPFAAPTTQHEADIMALMLFFVFSMILAGLIASGIV
jgi:hypothetical protein